jgi:hypothetical protein
VPVGPLPDGQAPESTDFANYFCTYAYIYHQVIDGAFDSGLPRRACDAVIANILAAACDP